MLVEVADAEVLAHADAAGGGFHPAEGQLDQGRLARAVGAGDAEPLAAQDIERQTLEQRQAVEGFGQALAAEDQVARFIGLAEGEADGLLAGRPVEEIGVLLEQAVEAGLAAAGGAAHAFLVLVAGDEVARALDHLDPSDVLPLLLEPDGLFRLDVVAVVARPDPGLVVFDLDDFAGDPVQQVAVMADNDGGSAMICEESLQPLGRLQVQVVRRLVKQQQVGLEHEHLGQAQPGQLPAAQGGRLDVVQRRRKIEGRQGDLDARLVLISAGELEFVAQAVVLPHLGPELRARQAFHLVRGVVNRLLELEQVLHAGVHLLQDRPCAAESSFLGQITDPQPLLPDHLAHVRTDLARDQSENGRFARAVRPDHADLLARVELEVQMVQHDLRPESHVNIL